MKRRLLILGGTGRTGRWLVREALSRNFSINVLVRDRNRLDTDNPDLNIFEGTPTNEADLGRAIHGCEAVLSALNISRKREWWPWSDLSASPRFLSEVARNLVTLCNQQGIRRVIVTSAWGTNETRKDIPALFRFFIDYSHLGVTYRDHERQEEVLEGSDMQWTIVRPVALSNAVTDKGIRVTLRNNIPRPNMMISRKGTAKFILDCFEQSTFVKQKPVISFV